MHFKYRISWCVVLMQICLHRKIHRGEKNPYQCLVPLTASELLIEEKMMVAAESDSTFARWTYAHSVRQRQGYKEHYS